MNIFFFKKAKLLGEYEEEMEETEEETPVIKKLTKIANTPQEKKYNLNENDIL